MKKCKWFANNYIVRGNEHRQKRPTSIIITISLNTLKILKIKNTDHQVCMATHRRKLPYNADGNVKWHKNSFKSQASITLSYDQGP